MMGDGKIFQDCFLKMALAGAFAGVVFWPSAAWANGVTPLIFASCFYMVVGNALIGVLEGLLIGLVFKVRKGLAILCMIVANYLSAWLGWIMLGIILRKPSWFNGGFERVDIYTAEKVIIGCVVASILITLIMEWPFCFLALGKKPKRWLLSVWAVLLAQSVSYGFLFLVVISNSNVSLNRHVKPDATLQYEGKDEAVVYYLGLDGKALHSISLNDFKDEILTNTYYQEIWGRLFIRKADGAEHWDLWAAMGPDTQILMRNNISELDGGSWGSARNYNQNIAEEINWNFFDDAYDLREAEDRDWVVWNEFWAKGLHLRNRRIDQQYHLAFETPLVSWLVQNVWILPGDYVVFQIGDQIVLLDVEGRRMRLLARGMGPAVVMRE